MKDIASFSRLVDDAGNVYKFQRFRIPKSGDIFLASDRMVTVMEAGDVFTTGRWVMTKVEDDSVVQTSGGWRA